MEEKIIKKYLLQVIALENAIKYIYESDTNNIWRFSGYTTFITKYNILAKKVGELTGDTDIILVYDEKKIKSPYDTIAIQQKNIFDSLLANVLTLRSLLESKIDFNQIEIENLINFLQSKLRAAIFKKPEKEKEIQDSIEQLLIGRGLNKGIEYDREVGRVKVSSKEVIPDFIFPRLNLALEVKLCTDETKKKKIIDEINADIQSYSKIYERILFVVYDLGTIRDEVEFKTGIDDGIKVSIIIVKH
jgi:hypothetical protein